MQIFNMRSKDDDIVINPIQEIRRHNDVTSTPGIRPTDVDIFWSWENPFGDSHPSCMDVVGALFYDVFIM